MSGVARAGRWVREGVRAVVPRRILRLLRPNSIPVPGRVDFGDLRRTRPISRHFGFERGLPVDRFYVERFLASHATDVRGHVLEVGDARYTRRFGGPRVTRSDVLHVSAEAPGATIVADLQAADHVPDRSFDCIILTQTLQLIFDVPAAVRTLHRILVPGGVVLATVPGISQLDRGEWRDTWYWSFTERSARRRFEESFGAGGVHVEGFGNVLAAVAFLEGLAAHELSERELAERDEAYPVCIGIRATKALGP